MSIKSFNTTIYIIDNDIKYTSFLKLVLEKEGFRDVIVFNNALVAVERLLERKRKNSVIISEMNFKRTTSDYLFEKLKEKYNDLIILILSKSEKIGDRLKAIGKYGAFLFIYKNDKKNILRKIIKFITTDVRDNTFLVSKTLHEIEECLI